MTTATQTTVPTCPHDPEDSQAYLTCPPCQRGPHVVAKPALRAEIREGRTAKMVTSETCFAGERAHLLPQGETGIYIRSKGWCCLPHGEDLL